MTVATRKTGVIEISNILEHIRTASALTDLEPDLVPVRSPRGLKLFIVFRLFFFLAVLRSNEIVVIFDVFSKTFGLNN